MVGEDQRQSQWLAALAVAAVTLEAAGCLLWLAWRFRRYEVAGISMCPTFMPGDFVVLDRKAFARRRPHPGEVVLAPDPREPSRTVLKRIARMDLHGGLWLEGDNPDESTDSRSYGWVRPDALLGRVVGRYWPLRR